MFLRSKSLSILTLVCILSATLANCTPQSQNARTITIAVVESNPGMAESPNPQSVYAGVKLATDQINALDGVSVQIDLYEDKDDAATALKIANEIVNSNAAAVIGHSSMETYDPAGKTYDQNKLPAINVIRWFVGFADRF